MAKIVDNNGYWLCKDCKITKAGVFPYLNRTVGVPEKAQDEIVYVLRPLEEVFKPSLMEAFNNAPKPFINDHVMLGKDATPPEKKGVDGVLFDVRQGNDKVSLVGNLAIYSQSMQHDIEAGKKELSLGYRCKYEISSGVYNGEHYDAVQRDIQPNHIALVDRGRAGHDVRVLDSAMTFDSIEVEIQMAEKIDKNALKNSLLEMINPLIKGKGEIEGKTEEEFYKALNEKLDALSYEDSEKSASDACGKDEDEEKKEDAEDACGKDEEKAQDEESPKEDEKKDGKTEDSEESLVREAAFRELLNQISDVRWDDDAVSPEEKVKGIKKLIDESGLFEKTAQDSMELETLTREVKELKAACDSLPKVIREDMKEARSLAEAFGNKIGTFDYDDMTSDEVAKYCCEKLGLDCEESARKAVLRGYLKGVGEKDVRVSMDSAVKTSDSKTWLENLNKRKC